MNKYELLIKTDDVNGAFAEFTFYYKGDMVTLFIRPEPVVATKHNSISGDVLQYQPLHQIKSRRISLFRWDIMGEEVLHLFYMQQRLQHALLVHVVVGRDDEKEITDWLRQRSEYLKEIWSPFLS